MAVLVFSNYSLTGNEADTFDFGHTPFLDGCDGFFDQSFEGANEGDKLFFLITDDDLRSERCNVGIYHPSRFRDRLNLAPMITGTIIETDRCTYAKCRVDRQEKFGAVYEQKPLPVDNEIIHEVDRYSALWAMIRKSDEQMGVSNRYCNLPCQLPSLSAIRDCQHHKLLGLRPDLDTVLLVELLENSQIIRVVALGGNDIDSSRAFDITDAEEYRAIVKKHRDAAVREDEAKFWNAILS